MVYLIFSFANMINNGSLDKVTNFHFIGICGISMSGIAIVLAKRGCKVSGSDANLNDKDINSFKAFGIEVFKGHSPSNISKDTQVVVKTSTVPANNPELEFAVSQNLLVIERYEVLNYLAGFYEQNIGVAGSNGKTTTTAYLWKVVNSLGKKPSLFLGSSVQDDEISGNAFERGSSYAIYETDESDASCFKMPLQHSIITNIDKDHLEFYGESFDLLQKYFEEYARNILAKNGKLVIGLYTPASKKLFDILKKDTSINHNNIASYCVKDDSADFAATNITTSGITTKFNISFKGNIICSNVTIASFGMHNVYNALGAFALAFMIFGAECFAGIKGSDVFKGLNGIDKRFMQVGKVGNIDIIDDYAHNPPKLEALIASLNNQQIWDKYILVFEPHKYTRLSSVYQDFLNAFKQAKLVFVMDIFGVAGGLKTNITKQSFFEDLQKHCPDTIFVCGSGNAKLNQELWQMAKNHKLDECKSAGIVFAGAGLSSSLAKAFAKSFNK